jgi:hypothetical protein
MGAHFESRDNIPDGAWQDVIDDSLKQTGPEFQFSGESDTTTSVRHWLEAPAQSELPER